MARSRVLFLAVACVPLAGCYAEGQSFFLAHGKPERFWSMEACVAEATAEHKDGTPKYAGYVCVHKVLFVELDRREFFDGQGQVAGAVPRTNEAERR